MVEVTLHRAISFAFAWLSKRTSSLNCCLVFPNPLEVFSQRHFVHVAEVVVGCVCNFTTTNTPLELIRTPTDSSCEVVTCIYVRVSPKLPRTLALTWF